MEETIMSKKISQKKIQLLLKKQRLFFATGTTKDIAFRRAMLKDLYNAIKKNEEFIADALKQDLGKPYFEAYGTEIGYTLEEIRLHRKKVTSWARKKSVSSPVTILPAKSFILPEPYGVSLIMAPWNYPFQLLMAPLIGSMSAGNCAILKPSEISSNTEKIITKIIKDTFPEEYIAVVTGGKETNQALLSERFDYIFFTGGPFLGKIVMQAASNFLTPLTLELGGKSPAIVSEDANIEVSAKRLAWGKFINAGQTCVAPDYVLVQSSVKDTLLEAMKNQIHIFYGENIEASPDYPRIVSANHFKRLKNYLKEGDIYVGGNTNSKELYIEPTIMTNVKETSPLMTEEIFGPILPVMEFNTIDDAIVFVNNRDKPLAQYLFTNNKKVEKTVLEKTSFGGGCVNDTIIHLANAKLPFGGVGTSGMGSYHGKKSFETFSHFKSMVKNPTFISNPIIYPPYKNKVKLLKYFMR